MSLGVLSVAFPFAVVGPAAVGGAEQILTTLETELVARGYRSVVVAREGSVCAGKLLPTAVPEGVITDEVREEVTRRHQAKIDLALATERIDLVHMHGIDFDRYRIPSGVPVLVTLHLPASWYPEEIWRLPSNYRFQCVSESQRRTCPAEVRDRLPVVGNGVLLPALERLSPRRKYALMLARICPEKNLHEGIEAARLAGIPVLLAGETFPYESHLRYFREEIEPRLGEGVRYVGAALPAEKARLLARARCLLLPTLAPETSSLVAMEAMAAGTPVVAYRSGAVPEIMEDGRTGFLVRDVAEMAAAMGRVDEINPAVCREVAATRFSLGRMVEGYTDLYGAMCRAGGGGSSEPEREYAGEEVELVCTVLRTTEELASMEAEWKGLWEADLRATPFQSPEWLLPWWRHVGEGELLIVILREAGGRLRSMLPLYVYTQPGNGERHLLLLGAGTSDYLDGLFGTNSRGEAERYASAMVQELTAYGELWDRAFFSQLRESSPLLAAGRRAGLEEWAADSCSSVRVEGWERLPAKIRLNRQRYRRRAEGRGRVEFHVARSRAEAEQGFEELLRLQGKRWKDGVLEPASVQAHHRESVGRLLEAGLLWMLWLTIEGKTVAVLYALVDPAVRVAEGVRERRMYSYLIGFEPELAELSPGTLLLAYAFDRCGTEGLARMDLLRGDEGYKRLWGAVPEPTFGVSLSRQEKQAPVGDAREAVWGG